jgi:hypothetical protein
MKSKAIVVRCLVPRPAGGGIEVRLIRLPIRREDREELMRRLTEQNG